MLAVTAHEFGNSWKVTLYVVVARISPLKNQCLMFRKDVFVSSLRQLSRTLHICQPFPEQGITFKFVSKCDAVRV